MPRSSSFRRWMWASAIVGAFAAGSLVSPPPLVAQRPKARMDYIHRSVDQADIDKTLAQLDADGWELVEISPIVRATRPSGIDDPSWIAVARRPVR